MPKGKKRRRRSFFSMRSIYKFLKIGAFAAPAAQIAMSGHSSEEKIRQGLMIYTGYDIGNKRFAFGNLARGWLPFVAVTLVTTGISKLMGMIRRL